MSTGCSGTPLWKKLGLKDGLTFTVLNPPPGYWTLVAPLTRGLRVQSEAADHLGCIHLDAQPGQTARRFLPVI